MWAVYTSVALMVLIYAMNIPIRCAFTIRFDEERSLKLGIGIFGARYIIERQLAIPPLNWKPSAKWNSGKVRAGMSAGRYLFRRARAEGMRFSAQIGTGDAARTALICGAVMGLTDTLRVCAKVEPNFAARSLKLSGGGIIHLRLGHSIGAGLVLASELANGKVRQLWTGIQSKASWRQRWRISAIW